MSRKQHKMARGLSRFVSSLCRLGAAARRARRDNAPAGSFVLESLEGRTLYSADVMAAAIVPDAAIIDPIPVNLGIADSREASDLYGRTLARGDFNNDGYEDLVVANGFLTRSNPDDL